MHWITLIVIAYTVSLLLTGMIIPQVLQIAYRRKLFDKPDRRKIHSGHVPRLGGTSFFPTVACAVSLSLVICFNNEGLSSGIAGYDFRPLLLGLCSVILLYFVGFSDDLVGVRYRIKFVVQAVCAALTIWSGVCITGLEGLLGIGSIPEWASYALTAFMVVYIVNAINLIDGIDGLASGLSAIAVGFYGIVFYLIGDYVDSITAWATCGTLVAFFYYNVFGDADHHSKIFMGDTGSLTIGMIISYLSLRLSSPAVPESIGGMPSLVVAFSPLLIPLFDVVRVSIHRVMAGRNPFLPDKSHIHHKLLATGLESGKVLSVLLGSSVVLIILNLWLSTLININLVLMVDVIVWLIGNHIINSRIKARNISGIG
ncbi:MAG: undecaprenyl/decaprenyl-phosphate alpha-N-acetylglucosaminyl 1-phosphate transferase [Clostridium sp.]|nr:undecaprenyl/decaprenyl-phosphate alpha-N-acetylglucosaminyl 1-phosphate transferase [Prevotella sp.]MCM1429159.1 undecaprenyl/decaprenyl-phosphate alpha-N-acetylglucosaminyl 1-phosphate transferase [Clostridium sp.]MCM1475313.1 undecaprenyl/decaprenyl-phosphate alpha-N-acetylglucosaminyl 1-phosphate transferase [Muribaculaceae bacterium]